MGTPLHCIKWYIGRTQIHTDWQNQGFLYFFHNFFHRLLPARPLACQFEPPLRFIVSWSYEGVHRGNHSKVYEINLDENQMLCPFLWVYFWLGGILTKKHKKSGWCCITVVILLIVQRIAMVFFLEACWNVATGHAKLWLVVQYCNMRCNGWPAINCLEAWFQAVTWLLLHPKSTHNVTLLVWLN